MGWAYGEEMSWPTDHVLGLAKGPVALPIG